MGGAVALGAAVDYLRGRCGGMAAVHAHHMEMGGYLAQEILRVPGLKLLGEQPGGAPRAALAAFLIDGLHATDVSTLLDAQGIAIRSGHHCTQPLHAALGVGASARASCHVYSTSGEVDALVEGLKDVCAFLREAMGAPALA